jgi:hypothetical protein
LLPLKIKRQKPSTYLSLNAVTAYGFAYQASQ